MTNPVYKMLAGFLVLLAALGCGWTAYSHAVATGRAQVQAQWDADKKVRQAAYDALKAQREKVTTVVEYKYRDRVRVIYEQPKIIEREVLKYVPIDTPSLPAGWRMLHDAAATGDALPDPARVADGAPVSAQDAAITVAENYAACRAAAEQVKGWQEWARAQQALTAR